MKPTCNAILLFGNKQMILMYFAIIPQLIKRSKLLLLENSQN